jgi:ACS family sodium-dependent inorganic phosphate cotransporter
MTEASDVLAAAQLSCKPVTPKVLIVACCFLATFTAYVERVGFSIAFTAMSKQARLDEHIKGNVLSAFYWGYGVSQVSQHSVQGSGLAGPGSSACKSEGSNNSIPASISVTVSE